MEVNKALKKLHDIQKEVEAVNKEGRNEFQKYNYLAEAQITAMFKPLLEKHHVLFTHSSRIQDVYVPEGEKGSYLTNVEVTYRFTDVDSGEYVEGHVAGQGSDKGDKGVYKAITGAVKYLFMKTFLIPTGDDPENEKLPRGKKSVVPDSDPLKEDED